MNGACDRIAASTDWGSGRRHCSRCSWSGRSRARSICLLVLLLIGFGTTIDPVSAQTCTVAADSTVTLTSGTCAITPGTTLTGSPGVHSSTSAAINTNNVTINPNNGGSIGALADTNGTILLGAGASINGNWSIAAEALSGGHVIFESGATINPSFGGGGTALLADGTGSDIQATGLSVNLNGSGNNVVARATNAGRITLTNDTISYAAGGGSNTGLWATGPTSQITSTGTTISMLGGGGNDVGAKADGGGTVALSQGAVTVTGNGGGETGLLAQASGSAITATNVAVTVSGAGGEVGAKALDSATITLNGGSVAATGTNGGEIGLQASGSGSTIGATDVAVTVPNSASGTGGQAVSAGTITLLRGSVSTGAASAIAVQATGAGSTITAEETAIATSGDNATGVQADSAGSVSLRNLTVKTTGASAVGLLATGAGSSINALGIDVTTSGSAAHAAAVTGGGSLTMTGNLTANGAGANALNVSGGHATLTVTLLTSPNGASIAAPSGTSSVNLNGVEAVVNNGQWLIVNGGATLNLASEGSILQGVALTDAGSTSNVTLSDGTLWTMTGNSSVTNLTNIQSEIQFTPPTGNPTLLSSYKTLTAVTYFGQSSTIGLNTRLGTDGSPSDRLVIDGGTASGNTFLKIANTTGAGALTTGNGILVVDAINGATTASGAFSLSRPVVAGPYEYTLFRSSVDAGNPEAW